MSDQPRTGESADAATEAAQNVVDEVTSWEYSADRETIEDRLEEGLDEAGVTVDDMEKRRLADDIDGLKHDETGGTPDVDGEHVEGADDA
jgi:hypothetical protein